jgi:hypothetical protein
MISYMGLFMTCPLFGACYSLPPKPFPTMEACIVEANTNYLGVCRKFKGKRFVGYISVSPSYGSSSVGDTK